MRILITTFIFSLLLVFSEQIIAQDLQKSEVVVIEGKKYVMHQVHTGETVYSISKKYKIDESILRVLNPKLQDGLKIGDVLKIPYVEGIHLLQLPVEQKRAPDGFNNYKIKSRRETQYSIAKKFGITVEELTAFNPKVRKYKKGVKLNIPFWNIKEEPALEQSEQEQPVEQIMHKVVSGETLYSISRKYNVPVNDILAENPNARNLKAGMTLAIVRNNVIKPELEKKETSVTYFEHIIESGETIWGITRKYGVSEAELKELNPILNTGFPAGAVIKVPVRELEKTAAQPVNEKAFRKHVVEKKETLYGLSKMYGLTIREIKKYNPVLETRNLVYGEVILIPEKPDEVFEQLVSNNKADSARLVEEYYEVELPSDFSGTCAPDTSGLYIRKSYNIALFLPLFLEANDTINRENLVLDTMSVYSDEEVEIARDTIIELEEHKELFKQFYGGSENFIQFYEGVLLAIDSLKNAGVNVRLNVFDTQQKADSIRKYIFASDFLATNLIIGPIFPSVQNEVAQLAAKNHIPIVSPLASQTTVTNRTPVYFQVSPSRDYIAQQTAEMVAEEYYNSNFIILKTNNYEGTPEGQMVELFREKFYNTGVLSSNEGVTFTFYDFENEGAYGLRRILSKTKENVVYIPSSNEGELSVAISNVNNLADDYSITLIGSNRYPGYSSIQIDHYHKLKLKYIAPYWVDYSNPATVRFIENFKSNFGTEPNNFGVQGYDVTLYFMQAITSFGANFAGCLPYLQSRQVQGNYHFEKLTQFGGYMNQGVSVIEYTQDYQVLRKRVMGQQKLMAGY